MYIYTYKKIDTFMRTMLKVCCLFWLLCSCEHDDFNETENASAILPLKVQTKRGNEVSKVAIDYIKLKTNNYNKLTQLPAFKNLFTNTFGESTEVNVTFELVTMSSDSIAGGNITELGNVRNQVIQLNKNHLITKHPLTIAQTIIHECIHAYLKVKAYECSSGTTVEGLNNQELDELLNEFDYSCLSTAVNEHTLMFDILVPYMQQMLTDLKSELVATENANPDLNFYPRPTYDLHSFSWTECFYYMTLAGLDGAAAFNSEINLNLYHRDLYDNYNSYINNSNFFNFNTCNE